MNKRFLPVLVFFVGIISFPSCIKMPKYRRRPLESLSSRFEYVGSNNKMILHAKRLNHEEHYYLFGERGSWLEQESNQTPIYPLYISFHNLSNTSYVLSPENIGLKLESHRTVVKSLQSSTTGKAAGTLAAGSAISVVTAGGGLYALFAGAAIGSTALMFGAKAALVTIPVLIIGTPIVSIFRSIRSSRINSTINDDLREKTLYKPIIIHPGQQFDTLIFVKRQHYRTNFSLMLTELEYPEKTLAFNVALGHNRFVAHIPE